MLVITRIQKEFPEADAYFNESLDLENHGFIMRAPLDSTRHLCINKLYPADDKNQYDYIFETWDKVESEE